MSKKDDFYIGYIDAVSPATKKFLKRTVFILALVIIATAAIFSLSQKPFVNSTFELGSDTKISGIYHENPYPMLRVQIGEDAYKNVVLLGFGKFGANKYLDALREKEGSLENKELVIEGNLIYFNGKTLLQITDDQKISLRSSETRVFNALSSVGEYSLEGEIVDPKCYFGVMKPGKGKIHRSCAVRCISGGIPPVLVTTDDNNISEYFLLTDTDGNPINQAVLPHIGKPSKVKGTVEKMEDWYVMRIDISDIETLGKDSAIY
ncbi:hypothetical protein GWK08_14205 [Leptobacterium flavescens]|uniref:Uncharacterized protein n=1 Tax=Leptobacterium flavescens TaxID=472055 RepID=A0A6P0UMW1_9FLAO|nr:hypothetical protein [Leptobacterium flavescens]NER14604.1 hypothetical protein [Leptobacterium flavescens]